MISLLLTKCQNGLESEIASLAHSYLEKKELEKEHIKKTSATIQEIIISFTSYDEKKITAALEKARKLTSGTKDQIYNKSCSVEQIKNAVKLGLNMFWLNSQANKTSYDYIYKLRDIVKIFDLNVSSEDAFYNEYLENTNKSRENNSKKDPDDSIATQTSDGIMEIEDDPISETIDNKLQQAADCHNDGSDKSPHLEAYTCNTNDKKLNGADPDFEEELF